MLRGGGSEQMFYVSYSDVALKGLGFANGDGGSGGCIKVFGSTIKVTDVNFTSCSA